MAKTPKMDYELVKRVQQGDKSAFDLLVIKYQSKILALIGNYIKNPQEVQDIAQEAFVKAYRALHTFRGDSAFYTWIYRIAINTAKSHLVSMKRKTPSVDIDITDAEHFDFENLHEINTPEALVHKEEIERVIFSAINSLPDGPRTAVILREIDGMSYEDIAEIMDCPVGTVRSRIFRAREAIDKVLQPLLKRS